MGKGTDRKNIRRTIEMWNTIRRLCVERNDRVCARGGRNAIFLINYYRSADPSTICNYQQSNIKCHRFCRPLRRAQSLPGECWRTLVLETRRVASGLSIFAWTSATEFSQGDERRRKADRPRKLGATRQSPRGVLTTVLKFPLVCLSLSSCLSPALESRVSPARSRVHFGPPFRPSSPSVESAKATGRGGGGVAELRRLKTYDTVIFIAFRRLYAPLNFNVRLLTAPSERISCPSSEMPARACLSALFSLSLSLSLSVSSSLEVN